MKKLILTTSAILAIATSAHADQQGNFPNWYIGLSAGVAGQANSEFKNGGSKDDVGWDAGSLLTASIGYQPPVFGGFRVEAEYSNHNENMTGRNGGSADVNVGAVNVYYDFFNSSVLTPYIGGGIGYGGFDIGGRGPFGSDSGGSDQQGIYQGMIGVAWQPTSIPDVAFDLGYRYFAPFKELKTDDGVKYDYDNNSVEVGARFKF